MELEAEFAEKTMSKTKLQGGIPPTLSEKSSWTPKNYLPTNEKVRNKPREERKSLLCVSFTHSDISRENDSDKEMGKLSLPS